MQMPRKAKERKGTVTRGDTVIARTVNMPQLYAEGSLL